MTNIRFDLYEVMYLQEDHATSKAHVIDHLQERGHTKPDSHIEWNLAVTEKAVSIYEPHKFQLQQYAIRAFLKQREKINEENKRKDLELSHLEHSITELRNSIQNFPKVKMQAKFAIIISLFSAVMALLQTIFSIISK